MSSLLLLQADEISLKFLVLFHQAILENDLPSITSMYESGWNKLTQASRIGSLKFSADDL